MSQSTQVIRQLIQVAASRSDRFGGKGRLLAGGEQPPQCVNDGRLYCCELHDVGLAACPFDIRMAPRHARRGAHLAGGLVEAHDPARRTGPGHRSRGRAPHRRLLLARGAAGCAARRVGRRVGARRHALRDAYRRTPDRGCGRRGDRRSGSRDRRGDDARFVRAQADKLDMLAKGEFPETSNFFAASTTFGTGALILVESFSS